MSRQMFLDLAEAKGRASLDSDIIDLAERDVVDRFAQGGDQRQDVLELRASSGCDNYADRVLGDVLLKTEVLIAGEQNIELLLGQLKQFAVRLAGPPSLQNGHDPQIG